MNIQITRNRDNFNSLKVGDVFMDRTEDIFMKIESNSSGNAVNLSTGYILSFDLAVSVTRITDNVKLAGTL